MRTNHAQAFTLVEVLLVVSLAAIAGALIVPRLGSTGSTRLTAAAQMLVADLEYAQIESVTHGDAPCLIVFDVPGNAYSLVKAASPDIPMQHPMDRQPWRTRLGQGRARHLEGVRIDSISVGTDQRLGFGLYGQLDQTSPAWIKLTCEGKKITITLQAATGEASLSAIGK